MTCTGFSLNSRNRSVSEASPQNPHSCSASTPAGGLPFLRPILYVHPLVQFLNAPLPPTIEPLSRIIPPFHIFIHLENLYSAPSRKLLRNAPSPTTVKEISFKQLVYRAKTCSFLVTTESAREVNSR